MKNLFIIKAISENMDISDEAFTVWCGLRNIMAFENVTEYFVTLTMIAHSVFNRVPNRYELKAIKDGYTELVEKEYITELMEFNKTDHLCDLSKLYFKKGDGYFSDLRMEEMHKIMNIEGSHSKYKLLRYFTAQVGSFNKSKEMSYWGNKIGGMSLDYFSNLIPIAKSTCVSFNEILEENELLFVIRHKDFFQFTNWNAMSEIREIPNTYSRWEDRETAKHYAENTHGYKYFNEQKDIRTAAANKDRGLAQKLRHLQSGKEYDNETIKEIYEYADRKNKVWKKEYELKVEHYNDAKANGRIAGDDNFPQLKSYDMSIFDKFLSEKEEDWVALLDVDEEYWGEDNGEC